jgi:hypothetical protein
MNQAAVTGSLSEPDRPADATYAPENNDVLHLILP